MARIEDERLLTGAGRFTESLAPRDALVAHVLRSAVANGRIRRLDTTAARSMPGIAAILTHQDLRSQGIGPLPCITPVETADGRPMVEPAHHALVERFVRHVGDPVACIVGESLEACLDAAEAVVLEIDALPACVDLASADRADAAQVHPEAPGNLSFTFETGDRFAVEAALASAAHVVSLDLVNQRIAPSPLETRGCIARWDQATERFELIATTQGVHDQRKVLATIFGLPAERIRVRTFDVGGGFGMKIMVYPEPVCCMAAARLLGRPVRWQATRAESFLSDHHGRDHVTTARLALDAQGRFTALAVDSRANLGAYCAMTGPMMPTFVFTMILGGCYTIPAVHARVRGLFTNMPPMDAYRGAGVPEGLYLLERLVDVAALRLGIDRVELRRRNLVPADSMPYTTALGRTYDVGDFAAVLDRALARSDWAGFPARRAASEARGRRRGIGLATFLHMTGGNNEDSGKVSVEPDGTVIAVSGAQSSGQGHETTLARIVAERLEIDPARVRIVEGDSDLIPTGAGTGGSAAMVVPARSLWTAAGVMLDRARELAARKLECATGDLVYGSGAFAIRGTDVRVTLGELAHWARTAEGLDDEQRSSACAGLARFEGNHHTFPCASYVAEVEVDPDTGRVDLLAFTAVHDLGRVIDPVIVDGQVHGGLAQGIGQALHERVVYDPGTGQLLSGTFLDYGLPRADDLPMFVHDRLETPSVNNPLGMKGVGECGTIGAPPAVIGAICDALGIEHLDMPAVPERVWRAARAKQRTR